jgi:hypothetical protein
VPDWPHVWTRAARPVGRKDHRCRIVEGRRLPQGLVTIEFKTGGRFIVERSGLQKAPESDARC